MNRNESMPIIESALAERPRNGSLLLLSFDAWDVPLLIGWNQVRREGGSLLDEIPSTRVWYRNNDDEQQQILVCTYACDSRLDAGDALASVLDSDQLARLERGPKDIGEVSFQHPPGVAPAILFTRANICVSVASAGGIDADVTSAAYELDAGIGSYPQKSKPGSLSLDIVPRTRSTYEVLVTPQSPPRNDFYQFWCGSGELSYAQNMVQLKFGSGERAEGPVYVFQRTSEPREIPLVASALIPSPAVGG